ncbi:MAG: biotin transporter BioY [Candidatus Omnitrophota bacterium]
METVIRRELITDKRICRIFAAGVFIIFTTLSAFVRIPLPFTPVPFTLQTFFVLLSGALLGRKLGVFTQCSYMFLGLTGLSVFTGSGSGALYLLGPTGGYIVGFIFSSFLAARLFEKEEKNHLIIFLRFLSADIIILASGMLWLKVSLSCSLSQAFLIGFFPFLLGNVFKIILAVIVYRSMHSRIKAILY